MPVFVGKTSVLVWHGNSMAMKLAFLGGKKRGWGCGNKTGSTDFSSALNTCETYEAL